MRALMYGLVVVAVVSATGCGPSRTPTFRASGEVSFRGKPLAEAGVMFTPTGSRPAAGVTDSNGRFTLRTWTEADGTVEGEHIVCISKMVPDAGVSAENPYPQGKNILPAKYASPLTSPLRATITRKGPNTFRFDLE